MSELKKLCMALLVMGMCAMIATAQSSIDKAIAEIEKSAKASITCTEKRDPETKQIYKMSKVIKFKGKKFAEKVREAIINESINAVEYTRIDSSMYSVRFEEDGRSMEYYLGKVNQKDDDAWLLTVEIKTISRVKARRAAKKTKGFSIFKGNISDLNNCESFALNFDGTTFYLNTDSLKGLENLDFSDLADDLSRLSMDLKNLGVLEAK